MIMSRCHSFYCISHSSDLMNKCYFAVCRWIWSSPKSSQMGHGTWSPSYSATIQMIVSHYRVSLTTRGYAQTPAESCPQSAQPRNPEPTWPAYLTLRGVLSVLHNKLWASMFWFHCHGLQTAIILAHFMMEMHTHFFILYSEMSLSMSSMLSRGILCFLLPFLFWNF